LKSVSVVVLIAVLCVGSLAASVFTKHAATPRTASDAVSSAEPQAQTRLVSDFSAFAGSDANARSLVGGLRQSSEITLTAGLSGMTTRFTPPTRPMDYGNVRVALVLAREQLAQLGITRPTPAQIKAVLSGGGIASSTNGRAASPYLFPGVLQMRAGGMGWQKIAGTMGVTLAQAMSDNADQADVPAPPDSRHPVAARKAGGVVPEAMARTDVPASRRPGIAPAPISSASITKSSGGGPRTAPLVKPVVATRGTANGEPRPERRRPSASVLAAADRVAGGEKPVMLPVHQDAAQGAAVMTPAAVPVASGELTGSEDREATE
jgi:hypothetical protein